MPELERQCHAEPGGVPADNFGSQLRHLVRGLLDPPYLVRELARSYCELGHAGNRSTSTPAVHRSERRPPAGLGPIRVGTAAFRKLIAMDVLWMRHPEIDSMNKHNPNARALPTWGTTSSVDAIMKVLGVIVLMVAAWNLYVTGAARSYQGLALFATAVQARCDLKFVRVRAAAGTLDLWRKPVPVVASVAAGDRLVLEGMSVRLGDSQPSWLAVSIGGHQGWVREDVVEPIRACQTSVRSP